jgi:hypothetical protein
MVREMNIPKMQNLVPVLQGNVDTMGVTVPMSKDHEEIL